jgi:hypothetical protein
MPTDQNPEMNSGDMHCNKSLCSTKQYFHFICNNFLPGSYGELNYNNILIYKTWPVHHHIQSLEHSHEIDIINSSLNQTRKPRLTLLKLA